MEEPSSMVVPSLEFFQLEQFRTIIRWGWETKGLGGFPFNCHIYAALFEGADQKQWFMCGRT